MSNKINRRSFLQVGALGTAGLSTLPLSSSAASKTKYKKLYRKLGNTGIKVPIVSLGVMRSDNSNMIDTAYNIGYEHFDTAHMYQNGRNEEMLGNFFKTKKRKSFTIATKIHPWRENLTTEQFLEQFEISLKRLQMSYVDILYLHASKSTDQTLNPSYLEALSKIKAAGKAKHIGVSTHSNIEEVITAATDHELYEVVLCSYNYKAHFNNEKMQSALQHANDNGMGIVAMKTMMGGFLDKAKTQPINCSAALKWSLNNPLIHTSIPGAKTYEELSQNFAIMSQPELMPNEVADLENTLAHTGLYCTGCEVCLPQCQLQLPVSDLMRSYMYNYGYGNPLKASETVKRLALSSSPCASCSSCTVKCTVGFDVKMRIADISRLNDIPCDFLT